jgi:hypothetical protein
MYVYEFGFWDGRKGADPEVRVMRPESEEVTNS